MFKKYGVLGIILIILVEINFFLKIEPFATWYFPIIWISYILVIDALVYNIRNKSLINNHILSFLGLFILSAIFWEIFEVFNLFIQNWSYMGVDSLINNNLKNVYKFISFSTVLPALFETTSLIISIKLFDKIKLKKNHNIHKTTLYVMVALGIICFFLPIVFPSFAFPLVWLSFFLILDPINYVNNQPSILGYIKNKRLGIPLSLLLAGIML